MTRRQEITYSVLAIAVALLTLSPLILHVITPKLTDEQQRQLYTLNNALYDFKHPTVDNAEIRKIECIESERKAAEYSTLPVPDIKEKVFTYNFNCRLKFSKARPFDGGP